MPNKPNPNFSLESLIPRIGNVPHFKDFSEQARKEIKEKKEEPAAKKNGLGRFIVSAIVGILYLGFVLVTGWYEQQGTGIDGIRDIDIFLRYCHSNGKQSNAWFHKGGAGESP